MSALVVEPACTAFSETADSSPVAATPASAVSNADAGVGDGTGDGGPTSDAATSAKTWSCDDVTHPGKALWLDFESKSQVPPYGFTEVKNPGLGTVSVEDAPDRPQTKALHFALKTGQVSREFTVVSDLTIDLASPSVRVDLGFDVRLGSSSLEYAALGMISLTGEKFASFTGIATYGSGAEWGGLPEADAQKHLKLPLATWHSVHTSVEMRMMESFGTTSIGNRQVSARLTKPSLGNRFGIELGTFFTSTNEGAADVWFDNVRVCVNPL